MISKLAELFVELTVKGAPAVKKELDAVKEKTEATGKQADKSAKQFDGFFSRLTRGVAQTAAGFATMAAGGAGFAGFIAGAGRGSVEADKFSESLGVASRVFNDAFAPYIRAATTGVIALTNAYDSLDGGTKNVIAGVLVAGAAIAAVGVAATGAAVAFGGLMSIGSVIAGAFSLALAAVTSLFTPLGMVAALAVAAGGILIATAINAKGGWGAFTDWMGDNWKTVIKGLTDGMVVAGKGILDVVSIVGVAFGKMFNFLSREWLNLSDYIAVGLAFIGEQIGILEAGAEKMAIEDAKRRQKAFQNPIDVEALKKSLDGMNRDFAGFGANLGGNVVGWLDKMREGVGGILGIAGKMFERFAKPGALHYRLEVQLESNQDTADRLLKAFASQSSGVELSKAQLEAMNRVDGGIQGLRADFKKIGDMLPAVR